MCHARVADGGLARANAVQEIARMTVVSVKICLPGPQGFADDVRRVGHQRRTIHGNASVGPDKTRAAFAAYRLAWKALSIHDNAVGVGVAGAVAAHENLHWPGVVGIRGPLHDVVMMLTPIELPDVERMRPHISVERDHRRRSQKHIVVKTVRHRPSRAEARGPENPAAVAVGVDGLEFADASTANEF